MTGNLLNDKTLEQSSVVANNAMNRERGLEGVNSYARDLGFHPLDFLRQRLANNGSASWLDLCCGSGRALIEAAHQRLPGLQLTGVDLVGYFAEHDTDVSFVEAPIGSWTPAGTFDLITCVHGLHYLGDKLGVLAMAAGWLRPGGKLIGHLDLSNILLGYAEGPAHTRRVLRAAGFGYDARRRLVSRDGPDRTRFDYVYIGADDTAGPNYTGQPAVASHYRRAI